MNSKDDSKDGVKKTIYVKVNGTDISSHELTFLYLNTFPVDKKKVLIFDYLLTKLSNDKYDFLSENISIAKKVRNTWYKAFTYRNMKYVNSLKCLDNIVESFFANFERVDVQDGGLEGEIGKEGKTFVPKVKKKNNRKDRIIYLNSDYLKSFDKS